MTSFFMPTIGSQFRLETDWTFRLHSEHRNNSVFKALGLIEEKRLTRRYGDGQTHTWDAVVRVVDVDSANPDYPIWSGWKTITMPAGTVLQIDRIYLRKGSEDFDSLTFLLVDSPDEKLKPWKRIKPGAKAALNAALRFWAKLPDVQGVPISWLTEPAAFGFCAANADAQTRKCPY